MPMAIPPHPGRLMRSAFEDLGVSVAEGAKALGVTRAQVYRVINGTSAISPEMALRLEVVIGSTADAWLRLQAAYDASRIRLRANDITKDLRRLMPRPDASSDAA